MDRAEVLVVGGGIVGLATARAVLRSRPGCALTLIDKEASVGAHQSGRNSGVIHAGVYYEPGSSKARLCRAGRTSMIEFCREHGIDHAVCGKLVVAVDAPELDRLLDLERRCASNDVRAEMLGPEEMREHEPHVAGVAALRVLDTGIVDYAAVCRALAADLEALGGRIELEREVLSGSEEATGLVVETTRGPIEAQRVVTCAGLQADRVAEALSGPAGSGGMRVMAFRGEYRELVPKRSHLVRGLVYPVPDPQYPFLGVHLTRGIDGHVHVGPNAVLAFAREGYRWRQVDWTHLRDTVASPGFRRFAARNWRFGLDEMVRSLSARRFTAAVRRLVPELGRADLAPAPAGVRAQAITAAGELVDDFAIHSVGRSVHVLNAPSPAATASLEIGAAIAARLGLDAR